MELLAVALRLEPAVRADFLDAARTGAGRFGAGRGGAGTVGGSLDGAGPDGARLDGAGLGVEPVEPDFTAAVGLRPAVDLIGREATLAELVELLDQAGLVTLVGLAGVGKTALAIAAGHRAAARFPGGIGGITVTDVSDETEILASMLSALGVRRPAGLVAITLERRCLLVVDGADRGLKPALAAIERLRSDAPAVTVLVTSRRPLGLPAEHEWPVAPLELPAAAASEAEIFACSAVAFFLDRLRRVRRRPVGLDEAVTLAALVRRLGGVPLALEIAAARGRILELEEMLARCLDTDGDADPAGLSLRAAVLGSWELLSPAERVCLSRLAVLQWRWSLPIAESLLAGAVPFRVDVVAVIDRLVSLGLVSVRPDAHEPRFWVLDAVREVARDEADRVGSLPAARDRHAVVIAELAVRYTAEATDADPELVAAAERWLNHLAPDIEAAIAHVRASGGPLGDDAVTALVTGLAAWRRRRGVWPDSA